MTCTDDGIRTPLNFRFGISNVIFDNEEHVFDIRIENPLPEDEYLSKLASIRNVC